MVFITTPPTSDSKNDAKISLGKKIGARKWEPYLGNFFFWNNLYDVNWSWISSWAAREKVAWACSDVGLFNTSLRARACRRRVRARVCILQTTCLELVGHKPGREFVFHKLRSQVCGAQSCATNSLMAQSLHPTSPIYLLHHPHVCCVNPSVPQKPLRIDLHGLGLDRHGRGPRDS